MGAALTWTRLDDGWTDRPILEQLPYETRWHYLAMVQFCSRTNRYDGLMRPADARRCSDVADPAMAVQELLDVGLLAAVDGAIKVVEIEHHVPPPHLRDEARKQASRERKARERAHKAGDHSYCLPDHCQSASHPVASEVTRDVGTGRDGTGRAGAQQSEDDLGTPDSAGTSWATVAVPGASSSLRLGRDDQDWSAELYAREP